MMKRCTGVADSRTKEREVNGLLEAMEYFNLSESYLITRDEEQKILVDGRTIHIVPLYQYLLNGG